jgi:hypothetical protein
MQEGEKSARSDDELRRFFFRRLSHRNSIAQDANNQPQSQQSTTTMLWRVKQHRRNRIGRLRTEKDVGSQCQIVRDEEKKFQKKYQKVKWKYQQKHWKDISDHKK